MAALMDIQSEERSKEEVIEDILQKMWKYVLISVKYKHTFFIVFSQGIGKLKLILWSDI